MAHKGLFILGLIVGMSGASAVRTEAAPITLVPQPQVAKNIAAFPRLPKGHASADAINKALDAADARVAKAAQKCTEHKQNAD